MGGCDLDNRRGRILDGERWNWMCAEEEGGCTTYISRWSEVAGVVEGDGRVTVDVKNHVLRAHPSFIFAEFKRAPIVLRTGI